MFELDLINETKQDHFVNKFISNDSTEQQRYDYEQQIHI